ncbi:MAG: sodium-dependent transporter, partial [Muribaculaceae bacterium]|nr:sodium-dependent transporter [Muribaculaceae bacterium]
IFPVTMSFGLEGEGLQGTTLVFVTLPEVFLKMPMSQFWAIMFFTLLVVAALTSCISTAECVVAFVHDRFKLSRTVATIITMLPIYALATLCSLSQGPLDYIHIFGKNIFDFLDNLFTNILLPTSAICLCVWMGWFAPKHLLEDELTNEGSLRAPTYPVIKFIIKYIAPVLILLVFLGGTVF